MSTLTRLRPVLFVRRSRVLCSRHAGTNGTDKTGEEIEVSVISRKEASVSPSRDLASDLVPDNINVDCVIGILSSKRPKAKFNESSDDSATMRIDRTKPSSVVKTSAEYSYNINRKLRRKAHSDYLEADQIPFPCQYTKELELRDHHVEEKLLKFPVDNQAIVWEESTVPFTEHIFLHKYLALFPSQTQRFMETIISSLQNNPDLTVEKKRQIIWGYYNYFDFHSDLLEEQDEEIIEV